MIEIIPNWHPVFVHFTIGLLGISALLYLSGALLRHENLLIAARWNLWLGVAITVGTVIAGWHAYSTVAHDALSHAAMEDHRRWALTTAGAFALLAVWALARQRGAARVSPVFVVLILAAAGLLAVTGYKGGELVYRHGTGVMSLPDTGQGDGHEGHTHNEQPAPETHATAPADQPDGGGQKHDHSAREH